MIILAVSDERSQLLEHMLTNSIERVHEIGMIVSCGDLDCSYLEFLVDATQKPLHFVSGNHPCESPQPPSEEQSQSQTFSQSSNFIAGSENLHGRLQIFEEYILLGFSGSIWYNGEGNQFTEEQMSAFVRKAISKLWWLRWKERITGHPHKKVIVISHAPIRGTHDQEDPAHKGFECFRTLLEKVQPLLWIHGHIHIHDQREQQITVVNHTTIVNAYEHKFITIHGDTVEVSSHPKK